MFFPAHSESQGETPAPNCTKHNHMLLFPHTRALNPPICFPPNAQPPELLSLHLFEKNKTKHCTSPLGMYPFRSTFPFRVSLFLFLYLLAFFRNSNDTSLLHSALREGCMCEKEKEKLSRDTTLNSMFLSLTIHLF